VCRDPLQSVNMTTGFCDFGAKNLTINCDDPGTIIDQVFDEETGDKIKEHGCHCPMLGPLSIVRNYVGGAGKLDEIDARCKNWFEARKCTGRASCLGLNLADYDYTLVIEGRSHVIYCEQLFDLNYADNVKQCLYDLCVIDANSAIDILYSLEDITVDWTSIVVTENECPHCDNPPCRGGGECGGSPPFYGGEPEFLAFR